MTKILLITPPFTQLNTPYPATAYLKGFLDDNNIASTQCDLSIELFNRVFKKDFVGYLFREAQEQVETDSQIQLQEVWSQREEYIAKVDVVLSYLRQPETTSAYQILSYGYLPKAHRSNKSKEVLDKAFGPLGILDRAKYLATQFIDELGDFIRANVDEFFAFTKYAEQIATAASSFHQLDEFLQYEPTLIENEMLLILQDEIEEQKPDLVCFTVPFPGNLFSTLRSSQFLKGYYPHIKIAMGGGYCNTELLSLKDATVFDYVDFITTGDGEGPIIKLVEHVEGKVSVNGLERTYVRENNVVVYKNHLPNEVYHHKNLPAPSYVGLPLEKYLSFLDVMNPMHRLWSDGKWNKLTIAHGCYWKQCSFCDVGLDYIANYEITSAEKLVNKIEKIISETGTTGFHFVDEAAPPQVLKALAKLLIEKKIHITWWTNIRFEKTFSYEFCELLARSGCIAITGGLEVASDRLLDKMNKGVDIKQVARVGRNFSENNIMVHAYLMYGFPTQTSQETVDALEVVRQLFENKCIQSAFWHRFTTTVHSPIGKDPGSYGIKITGPEFYGFAQNDLYHDDPDGADHSLFGAGLNSALEAYLNGTEFNKPLQEWFDFEVEQTKHSKDYISSGLK
jgi:hypothetical protein